MKRMIGASIFFVAVSALLLVGLVQTNATAQAQLPVRPTLTPTATSTPVPTATPTPVPTATPVPLRMLGGGILLQAPSYGSVWTVVQWLDEEGEWNDVSGWQGWSDETGEEHWWVHPRNLGQTDFRWQFYTAPEGTLLYTTATFDLPGKALERVVVEIK